MGGVKLQKRAHDFFVSYGHDDGDRVAELVSFLRKPCGLSVWFDRTAGNAAQRSSELLAGGLGNARGALIVLSEAWERSTWCRNEFEVALNEQRGNTGFELVVVRIDQVEIPSWMRVGQVIDIPATDPSTVSRLLSSLTSDVPHRFDNGDDVYLAAPWSRPTAATRQAVAALRPAGWRLVGDSPDLTHLGEDRIASIMRTTRGAVAVLPRDPSHESGTSPWVVAEAELALRNGLPLLLIAEDAVLIPPDLAAGSFGGAVMVTADQGSPELVERVAAFDEHLSRCQHTDARAYVFLAGSVREDPVLADQLGTIVERASNMACVRGERLPSANVQAAIVERIQNAAAVIADVTDDHRNTLIEAGIAMGSGTPLRLVVRAPGGVLPKKRFMFEGHEIYGFDSHAERLGLCFWLARQFRRRVYVGG